MTFTFDDTIPAANNNPSDDQPIMLANNVADSGIWEVDHLGYNATNGGQHKLVRFNVKATPAVPTDPVSALYTNSGTASTVAQMFYRNQNRIFHAMPIKAWGYVDGASGNIIATQSFNVDSTSRASAGNYTITLTANAVNSSNYAILVSSTKATISRFVYSSYTITSATQFSLVFDQSAAGVGIDVTSFSFIVIQI